MILSNFIIVKEGIILEEVKEIMKKYKIEKFFIVDDEGNLKGFIIIKDIEKVVKYLNAVKDSKGRLFCAAVVGVLKDIDECVDVFVKVQVDVIVVDIVYGYLKGVIEMVKRIKLRYLYIQVVVGNIVIVEAVCDLIEVGVDCVKVGIGLGFICIIRVVVGIGVLQIIVIMDVVEVVKEYGIFVIVDGGIRYLGDIIKVLAVGVDVVMIGSFFVGCEESSGECEIYQGRRFKVYRGMGLFFVMKVGSKDRYFQEDVLKFVFEGVEGRVLYKGLFEDIVFQFIGGLKFGMGYCGVRIIKEF